MRYAMQEARRGVGFVEPNPAVGAVVVDGNRQFIAAGHHQQFGQAHAEVNAIAAAGALTKGAQLFVTLEPCSHQGKTPPCADAVIAAGFSRVVVGCQDPAPHVSGQGIERIRKAGIAVEVGVCQDEAEDLIAPFRKLMLHQLPWVHVKWAMTLDGRIASRTGHSKWISSLRSREVVHALRGRMDAIITGAGTVRADNPTLTARPAGPKTPLRVVMDSTGESVTLDGKLVSTIQEAPVLLSVAAEHSGSGHVSRLAAAGVQIHAALGSDHGERLQHLLKELGQRKCTNVLLEAGAGLLGTCFDQKVIDEVHVFVAPKLVGGRQAMSPLGGEGLAQIPDLNSLKNVSTTLIGNDVLIEGGVVQWQE